MADRGDCTSPAELQSHVIKQSRTRLSDLTEGFRVLHPERGEAELPGVDFLPLDAEECSAALDARDFPSKSHNTSGDRVEAGTIDSSREPVVEEHGAATSGATGLVDDAVNILCGAREDVMDVSHGRTLLVECSDEKGGKAGKATCSVNEALKEQEDESPDMMEDGMVQIDRRSVEMHNTGEFYKLDPVVQLDQHTCKELQDAPSRSQSYTGITKELHVVDEPTKKPKYPCPERMEDGRPVRVQNTGELEILDPGVQLNQCTGKDLQDVFSDPQDYATVEEEAHVADEACMVDGVLSLDTHRARETRYASTCLQDVAVAVNGLAYDKLQTVEVPIAVAADVVCQDTCFGNECTSLSDSEVGPLAGDNRRLSLKRSHSFFGNTPCVQVIYKSLTSESKNKLKDFMHQWAAWHGKSVCQKDESVKESLESGDEVYFPALRVVGQDNLTVSFWMDKPVKQARLESSKSECNFVSQEREKEVPLYDRVDGGPLVSEDVEMLLQGNMELMDENTRCFNCGSYSHSLKECPHPKDTIAINNARKLFQEKRGAGGSLRNGSNRYYQSSPGGKFDDLKPGVLGSETRQLLGIGELDPPPWLQRMRELGYPPGYLEDQEDEPSGITIFGTNDGDTQAKYVGEDGEIVGDNSSKRKSSKHKMMVSFAGINAPIPDNADKRSWAPPMSGHSHSGQKPLHRIGYPPSHHDGVFPLDGMAHRGGGGWPSTTGTPATAGQELYAKSPKLRSPGVEDANSHMKGSPHGQSKGIASRTPHWGRSLSDSGRRSPKLNYEDPRVVPTPPVGPPLGSRHTPPMHGGQRPYQQSPLTPSPTQRGNFLHDYGQDEYNDARRRAWIQANNALEALHHGNNRHPPPRR